MPPSALLLNAISTIPPGSWAVAVSGGADSVALLCLLHDRQLAAGDIALHVVHLNHETRGPDSAGDAAFVGNLAAKWSLPCTLEFRSRIESGMHHLPTNASARYRAARLELFRQVIARHSLAGVLLAHHADDQAETVFLRLLRGSGPAGLAGMSPSTRVAGITLLRPLLGIPREMLRSYLVGRGQSWREDASNESPKYRRNRARRLLGGDPKLRESLLEMGAAFARLGQWVHAHAPVLPPEFEAPILRDLPDLLARESARRWLIDRGCPPGDLSPDVLARLLTLARDAAAPPRAHFPGTVLVRRRGGVISADAPSPV